MATVVKLVMLFCRKMMLYKEGHTRFISSRRLW